MKSVVTIEQAMRDGKLFGAGLGDLATWRTWRTALKAAFGRPLVEDEERDVFTAIAGARRPPQGRVRELWAIIGRRGGKSRVAALIAAYIALFEPHHLARGETGMVLVLAASRVQAQVVFQYVVGMLQASPLLAREIDSITATEIRLRNGVVIATHANGFRTVRGRTLLACVMDEIAFWRDEASAVPDIETYRAVLPALATTHGMLIGISTPYRRSGLLHTKHRHYYGMDDDQILVVQGSSKQFNPTLDEKLIAAAVADDPQAMSEWEAEFRADISAFLDDEVIEAAIDHSRPLELPPRPGLHYRAFVDASGGRSDHYTVSIAHSEAERCIVDVVRGRVPPFDPQQVTREFAALAKEYRCFEVTGDNYAAQWVEQAWRDTGLSYRRSEHPRSDIYQNALPLFTRGIFSLPDHGRLLKELRLLERRTSRMGKDVIDHGRNGSDDYANAVCGAAVLATENKHVSIPASVLAQARIPRRPGGFVDGTRSRRFNYDRANQSSFGELMHRQQIGAVSQPTVRPHGLTGANVASFAEMVAHMKRGGL